MSWNLVGKNNENDILLTNSMKCLQKQLNQPSYVGQLNDPIFYVVVSEIAAAAISWDIKYLEG